MAPDRHLQATTPRAGDVIVATTCLALIGYGEVGSIFGAALAARGVACVRAYDVAACDGHRGQGMPAPAREHGVALEPTLAEAMADAQLVNSAVTASRSLAAATAAARGFPAQAFYLDLNSASPGTKAESGVRLAGAGAPGTCRGGSSPIASRSTTTSPRR